MYDLSPLKTAFQEAQPTEAGIYHQWSASGGWKQSVQLEHNKIVRATGEDLLSFRCTMGLDNKKEWRSISRLFGYNPDRESLSAILEELRSALESLPPSGDPRVKARFADVPLPTYDLSTATASTGYVFHRLYPYQRLALERGLLLSGDIEWWNGGFQWNGQPAVFAWFDAKDAFFAPETRIYEQLFVYHPYFPDQMIRFSESAVERSKAVPVDAFAEVIAPFAELKTDTPVCEWQPSDYPEVLLSEEAVGEILYALLPKFSESYCRENGIDPKSELGQSVFNESLSLSFNPDFFHACRVNLRAEYLPRQEVVNAGLLKQRPSSVYDPVLEASQVSEELSPSLAEAIQRRQGCCVIYHLEPVIDWNGHYTGQIHCPNGGIVYADGRIAALVEPFILKLSLRELLLQASPATISKNVAGIGCPSLKIPGKLL